MLAEAGIPVGFLAMPTLGTTAPATLAGALAMGDAEIISAAVLMQLMHPGAPVFHSLMQAWADPRTGGYVSYPLDAADATHRWKWRITGACLRWAPVTARMPMRPAPGRRPRSLPSIHSGRPERGRDRHRYGAGQTYTLLYPEQIILDDDLYQRARYHLMDLDVSETLALDTSSAVGPGGHFLGQKHTRKHMRDVAEARHHPPDRCRWKYRDPREVAIEQVRLDPGQPSTEPLEAAQTSRTDPHPGCRR